MCVYIDADGSQQIVERSDGWFDNDVNGKKIIHLTFLNQKVAHCFGFSLLVTNIDANGNTTYVSLFGERERVL